MGVKTPDWVKHAVFYQIFPDRFSRSPRLQHSPGIQFKSWARHHRNRASKAVISWVSLIGWTTWRSWA